MNKIHKLLIAFFLLTQFVFAAITLRINVSPAGTYSGTLYYYNTSKVRQGDGVAINTDASGLATIYFPSGAAYQSFYFGLKLSGKAENFANNQVYLDNADVITLGADGSISNVYFTALNGYTLSGQIQDASGMALGAGVTVNLFEPGYVWRYAVKTDSSGNYSFPDIISGTYFISAGTDGVYFPKWYNGGSGGAYGSYDWTTINVVAANISGLNVRVPLKATVNGTVSAYGGSGLTGKTVQAFVRGSAFNYVNQVSSGTSGVYTMDIPAGVDLMLRTLGGTYLDTYYNQVYTWPNSTTVNATGGAALTGYNFVMHNNWIISGNVNVANAKVEVFEYNNWSNYVTETVADASGHYSITGMNNQNVMLRISAGNNYTKVIYPSLLYFSNISVANRLSLTEGNTYNLSNVTLGAAGTIAGTITAVTGSGIVTVSVTTTTGNYFTHVTLNAGSSYSAPSIPVGNWKVRAERNGCVTEYYGGVSDAGSATTVNVTSGATTSGINIALGAGWAISGNVKDVDSTNISGAAVKVFRYQAGWIYVTSNMTDSNGNYTIRDIYNGDIFLKVENSGYRSMIWDNQLGDWPSANHFVVSEGFVSINNNFRIFQSATINGTVTYTSGGNAAFAVVKAFSAPGNVYMATATANASGVYALSNLIPGNVKILASTGNAISEYYNDIAITTTNAWTKAATINVPQGANLTGYNFALLKTFALSGTVTSNHSGAVLPGVTVNAFDPLGNWVAADVTDGSGQYSIALSDGSYYIQTESPTYFAQYYKDAWGNTDRTAVVMSGANKPNINFSLHRNGTITGIVRDGDSGSNLNNVMVYAFLRNSSFTYVTKTTANGTYSFDVPAGVPLMIKTLTTNYEDVFYNGVSAWNTSTTVNVAPGGTSTNINFNLYRTWMITGNVQNRTGTPLTNIKINLYNSAGVWLRSVSSNAGYYSVTANNGSFYLKAEDPVGGLYFTQWYSEAYGETDRTVVTVSNANLTGQNFSLYRLATITGTLRDESSSPLNNAVAQVFLKDSSFTWVAQATSNIAGSYSVTVPATVELMVRANRSGYQTTFYNNVLTWGSATTVNATAGSTVSGININLNRWWRIGGHVYTSDGSSASGATVVYQVSGNLPVTVSVASDGSYDHQSTQNTTYPVLITYSKTDYITVTRSVTVVIGVTDITTYNVTLNAQETPLPDWYSNIEDSIKSGPNPANPDDGPVHIGFVVEDTATAKLLIYTMGGEIVFSDSKRVDRGYHEFLWEGDDRYNENVANGLYLGYMEIKTGGKTYKKVLKIAILR